MSICEGSYFLNLSDCESFIKENQKFISKYFMPLNWLFELALTKKQNCCIPPNQDLLRALISYCFFFFEGADTLSGSTTKVTFKVLMWINHIYSSDKWKDFSMTD